MNHEEAIARAEAAETALQVARGALRECVAAMEFAHVELRTTTMQMAWFTAIDRARLLAVSPQEKP